MGERLTIEQLREEQAYLNLTDPQQRLIEVFLQTGSKLKAVQAAYNCASEKTARVMTYTVFRMPNVVACLAVANGVDSRLEIFKEEVRRAVLNKKLTYPQLGALKLYAQLHGFVAAESLPTVESAGESEAGPQKFQVGAIIVQDEKRYQIVAQEIE